jgi:cell division protein FtsQ
MAPTRTERSAADEPTVRLARKQFARRQWARRWLVLRGVLAVVLLLGAVGAGVWAVFFSSALAVADVRVEGASLLHRDQVRRAARVPMGEPLATVDLKAIRARVEALAPVESVDVTRSWPHSIRIAVTERDAVAVVVRDGVVRGLDENGVLFRRYPRTPPGMPVVHMAAHTRAEALAEAAKVVAALPADLAAKVDYVDVQTVDRIALQLRDGRTVRWGSADESDSKSRVLAVLLKQRASVYDVSVPGRPTIRR